MNDNQNDFNNQNNMGLNPVEPLTSTPVMPPQSASPVEPVTQVVPTEQMQGAAPVEPTVPTLGPVEPTTQTQAVQEEQVMNNYQPQNNAPQEQKKNNKMLFIIIGIVVGAIVIGLGVYFGAKAIEKKKAQQELDAYEKVLKLEEEERIKKQKLEEEEKERLQKNYTATIYRLLNKRAVLEFKNNNSVVVNADLSVEFYDENEQLMNVEKIHMNNINAQAAKRPKGVS